MGPALAQSAAPSGGADNWPWSGTLKDGSTFTLKQSIVDKLKADSDADATNDVPIEYLFKYGSASIPLFSPQYAKGYERSIPEAQKILPSFAAPRWRRPPRSRTPSSRSPRSPRSGRGRPHRLPVDPDDR